MELKRFQKNPIKGTKFTIAISSAKGGVGKSGDNGKPIVEENPNNEISKIYIDFANKIKSTYL